MTSILPHRSQSAPRITFLIAFGVVTKRATHRNPEPFWMREIARAALAAPAHKPGLLQIRDQLSHFTRHFSISLVSPKDSGVKDAAGQTILYLK
jgi:hypothetical protein